MNKTSLNQSGATELAESIKKLQLIHAQISELIVGLNKTTLKVSSDIKNYSFSIDEFRYGFKKDTEKYDYLNNLSGDYYNVGNLLSLTAAEINRIASKFDEVSISFSRESKKILELNNSEAYNWINLEKYEAEQ